MEIKGETWNACLQSLNLIKSVRGRRFHEIDTPRLFKEMSRARTNIRRSKFSRHYYVLVLLGLYATSPFCHRVFSSKSDRGRRRQVTDVRTVRQCNLQVRVHDIKEFIDDLRDSATWTRRYLLRTCTLYCVHKKTCYFFLHKSNLNSFIKIKT